MVALFYLWCSICIEHVEHLSDWLNSTIYFLSGKTRLYGRKAIENCLCNVLEVYGYEHYRRLALPKFPFLKEPSPTELLMCFRFLKLCRARKFANSWNDFSTEYWNATVLPHHQNLLPFGFLFKFRNKNGEVWRIFSLWYCRVLWFLIHMIAGKKNVFFLDWACGNEI